MIPVATTTISINRTTGGTDNDFWEPGDDTTTVIASGVNASIQAPSGRQIFNGGEQDSVVFRLLADPCDLTPTDIVTDDATGAVYHVEWAENRVGLGMEHVVAGLKRVTGVAIGGG